MAEGHIIKIVVSVGKRPSIRERKFGCTRSIDQRSEEVRRSEPILVEEPTPRKPDQKIAKFPSLT